MLLSILLSFIILVIALLFQLIAFKDTQSYRKELKDIFPESPEYDLVAEMDEENVSVQIKFINGEKESSVFNDIVDAINNYLEKNQGSTDYSTLKDITDRQSDAIEAKIDATAPMPIYIGLCGTVMGIVIGVGVLAFGGGLESLLTVSDTEAAVGNSSGSDGITMLLQGVAVAMISTFCGVLLTILGSRSHKKATSDNEKKKNQFLNWMQGELLPQMKHDMANTLVILQKNLSKFNKDFASNSRELNRIFMGINTSYQENTKLLEAVQKLDIDSMANANIRVLNELRSCTDQINDLHEFLGESNKYLRSVETLNCNLSDHLDRTKLIEDMAKFYKDEIKQIEQRKNAISQAVGNIDLEVQKSIEGLSKHTGEQYRALTSSTSQQHLEFMQAVEQQQKALNRKLEETSVIVDELKNLTSVKDSLMQMVDAANRQNEKIDKLLAFEGLLESLGDTGSKQNAKIDLLASILNALVKNGLPVQPIEMSRMQSVTSVNSTSEKVKLPVWAIVLGSLIVVIISLTCVIFILKTFELL